jgi:hypothetical protein
MDEARTAACWWIWSAALEGEEAGLRRLPRGASAAVPTEDAGATGKGRRPVGRAKGPGRVGLLSQEPTAAAGSSGEKKTKPSSGTKLEWKTLTLTGIG